jgi:hypothetical protein
MASRNARFTIALVLAVATFPFVLNSSTLLTAHADAAEYAKRHGQQCLALLDPTVGHDTPEHWLPLPNSGEWKIGSRRRSSSRIGSNSCSVCVKTRFFFIT